MGDTRAQQRPRPWWRVEPGPLVLGLAGGLLTLAAALGAYAVAEQGWVLEPPGGVPLTLAAMAGGAIHAVIYRWSRDRAVWGLPVYLVLAGWFAGMAGGALITAYTVILVPALLGFPDLNRNILDLQPPFTTPFIALVTMWAVVGLGAVVGGVVGAAVSLLTLPVVGPLWALARLGRWLLRSKVGDPTDEGAVLHEYVRKPSAHG
ncbi:MAG: hypothetical protein HY689_00125 [Chloroflexi bacterium]|nr:hypothetical protein [Chloroflexota bacterium]